jgi:hypothetical protein
MHAPPASRRRALRRLLTLASTLGAALGLAACGEEAIVPPDRPPEVVTIRLRTATPSVAPGDSLTVIAEPVDAGGQPVAGAPVTWQWSDSSALTGAAEGATLRLRAVRPASVLVTVRSGAAVGALDLTVRFLEARSLRLTVSAGDSLVVGAAPIVGVQALDSLGRVVPAPVPVITTTDPTIAEVRPSSAGPRLHALAAGRTEVVATAGALRATVAVRVWPPPRVVFPDTSVLLPGLTRTLRAQELPMDQQARPIARERWISGAPEVATVSATGVVTAVGPGRATIFAIAGEDTLRALVVVKPPAPPVEYVAVVPRAPCAVSRDGGIYCWGSNSFGQLGTDEIMDRCESFQPFSGAGRMWWTRTVYRCSAQPVRVQSASRFVAGSGNGSGVCGLTAEGAVECWGYVPRATGSPTGLSNATTPVSVAPGLRVAAIDGRCLLSVEGDAHCWGDWTVPIYEDGTRSSQTPQRLPSPVKFRQLSAGTSHLCGVTAEDALYCWGSAYAGQIGVTGSVQAPGCFVACEPRPRRVEGLPPTRAVQVSSFASSCALDREGVVRCWGEAYANGRTTPSPVPAPIPDAPRFVALSSTDGGTQCGLTAAGELWCWGGLFHRPDGSQVLSTERAQRAAPNFPLRTVAGTAASSCGLAQDGRLFCWGQGPIGDGVWPDNATAFRVAPVVGQR